MDLIITRASESPVSLVSVMDSALVDTCDHFPVHFKLPVSKPRAQRKVITYRQYKRISAVDFAADMQESLSPVTSDHTVVFSKLS